MQKVSQRVGGNKFITYLCSAIKQQKKMPTLFILFGFKFMFYSNDHAPIHVHVLKGGASAKFNVVPEVVLVENNGMKPSELKLVESIVEENKEIIIERWNTFFNGNK